MANSNMGDLSMTLTLKSRVEEETRKIIKDLNKVDETGKTAQKALDAISEAIKGIGSGNMHALDKYEEFLKSLSQDAERFPKEVIRIQDGLSRVEGIMKEIAKTGSGFSIFPNGVSKEVNDAAKGVEKLSSFINELNNKHGQGLNILGVDATQNIRQSISELSKYRSILEQIKNNGGVHPITGLTASDVLKSSGYQKAIDGAKEYAREIKQSLKDADASMRASVEEEKKNEQIVEGILQRRAQERQKAAEKEAEIDRQRQEQAKISAQIAQENAKSEIKWNEQKARASSEALQRQMRASVEEEKKRQVSFFSNGFDTSILERRLAMLNRMSEIQDKLAYYHPKAQYAFLDYESGLKFGNANTPEMRHKEDELQRLRNIISDLEAEFNKLGGNDAFKNVDSQVKNLEQTIARLKESGGQLNLGKMLGLENKSTDEFRIAKEAAMATEAHTKRQNELNAAFEKYFRVQEQVEAAEKRLAEATARTNQARREAITASRQQAESLVRDRVKELEAQRQQLQGLYGGGKGVLDVQGLMQIQQAFSHVTQEINTLRTAMNNLGSYSIKDLFSIGRGTSDYSPLISSMRTVIDQKQEAINLERKHQEEISRTAAKARNDLAAAFAGANEEAKKMQSIVGDIKSLFLQGGIVFGAQQFFNSIVQTGGEIVQQHVALRSILGDVEKADELFQQTQQLALQSPFKFGELNRDVKQLAAFGVEANDLYDTTKRLADIASGLGVSFERLGLAYGQVKARSWLDGKELRQFAYAGLPLLQKITELYNQEGKNGRNNYTQADVKKMITGRQVSFEDVQKVLWNMTNEGGQFYNMQLVLSETLLGRWNKLIDAWDIMLGKFAEGKSVVGGTFSFIINRVTDLILAFDKVSGAALAFGAMYALRKGATLITSKTGIASNLASLQAEQQAKLRTYAVEQQRLLIEGRITQEQMRQNIADYQTMINSKINTRNAVEQAALEGRLSALKMQKAFREKLISSELVEQLRIMGMISAKESELITKEGTMARMSLMANQAKSKIGGFFSGWNIATIGLTIGAGIASAYSQFRESIEQDTKNINESAKNTAKVMEDTLSEIKEKGSGELLQQQVDKMTDVLEQSGLYTDSIKEQIESTNDLGKEYDILKQKIIEAKEANTLSDGDAIRYAEAKTATGAGFAGGAGFWGYITGVGQDNIDENTDDVANNLAKLQMKMEKFSDSTKSSMDKVANSILGAKAAGMTFEEKIAEICNSSGINGYWETFVKKVSHGNKDVEKDLRGLGDDLDDFSWNFGEIATDDIPKYLEYMAESRNMDMNEFSKWCKQHPREFKTMLDKMLSEANKKVPSLVERLQSVAMAILNIGKAKPQNTGENKPKVWKNPNKVGTIERKVFDKLFKAGKLNGGKKGFWQKEMGSFIYNLNGGNSSGWMDFGEAVRKKYREVRNENDASKKAGDKQPYLRQQRMLEEIAAQNGINLDVGKNKVTGNFGKDKNRSNKEDKELKALQERINGFKTARQEYLKYKPVMGEAAARKEVERLFPNVKGLNLNDYIGSIKKIMPNNAWFGKSPERKKLLTTINREMSEWKFSETLKPEFDKIGEMFREALEEGAKEFDLYRNLLDKTGSKEFAMQAFKNGIVWDDQTRGLARKFKEMTGLDADMDASDAEVKDKFNGIAGAYDTWKRLTDLLHSNYTEALNEMAELIANTASYDEKLISIEEKYKRIIDAAKQVGDERGARAAQMQMDKEKSSVNIKKMEGSMDYAKFFSRTINQSKDEIQKYASFMKDQLSKALDSGAITAEEYSKKIEEINKRMEGLNDYQFLGGGLNGMVDAKRAKGQRMSNEGQSVFDNAKKAYDTANAVNDIKGMTSAKEGMEAGKTMMDGGQDLMQGADQMAGSIGLIDKIIHGINDLVQGFNDTFQDIKETAEALGNDTTTDDWTDANTFLSSFSSASDSATKGWDSLKEGNIGGVISGVVGSWTGWIKGFAQGHDQKLDNQIKIAERQIKLLENISSSVKQAVDATLGGIYGYKMSDYTKSGLESVKSDYERRKQLLAELNGTSSESVAGSVAKGSLKGSAIGSVAGPLGAIAGGVVGAVWSGISSIFNNKRAKLKRKINKIPDYQDDTYAQTQKALKTQEAYDVQLAALYAQRDQLRKQRDAEDRKKNSDKDKLADYDKQIEDAKQKIDTFTQDWLKDVYDVDLKNWASQLTEAIVDAWSNGEDAANAYHDKVKELMKDLTKKIVTQSIVEMALQPTLDKLKDMMTKNSGKLTAENVKEISKSLIDIEGSTVNSIEALLDQLKKDGLDLRENGSSSATNSIKSITEETADLLASYINSIRLDISVMREWQGKYLPELSEIAKSQLTQLNLIAQNTLRSADAAERIEKVFIEYNDNFNRVLNGTKSLKMR